MAKPHPKTQLGRGKPALRFPTDEADGAQAWKRYMAMKGKYCLEAAVDTPIGTFSAVFEGGQHIAVMVNNTALKPEHHGLAITSYTIVSVNGVETRNWGDELRKKFGTD